MLFWKRLKTGIHFVMIKCGNNDYDFVGKIESNRARKRGH